MNQTDAIILIKASVPAKFTADAETLANAALTKAVSKVGRMRNVDWNREQVDIVLTSGKAKYIIGVDILSKFAEIYSMKKMWHTDSDLPGIPVQDVDKFNVFARGNDRSGRPLIATIHSKSSTLEFWPNPDSDYTIWCYVRKSINSWDDIPAVYRDVVTDEALRNIRALGSAVLMNELAKENLREMQLDSDTEWDGSQVNVYRPLSSGQSRTTADKYDPTGGF